MYRTIVTSAAVAVAALAIVAGASAVTGPPRCMPNPYYQSPACAAAKQSQPSNRSVASRTAPVGCLYAMPASRAQALACASRDVNAPLSPAVIEGIRKARAAKGLPLSPDVRQELYDANQRIAAAVPAVTTKSLPLSEKARQAIYSANHRASESLPTTSSDALDPAIATAMKQANYNATLSTSTGSSFNWGSAGIGAAAGALLLIAAVGSGAIVRRRRPLLHA